jgi:thiamine biosynthesis lipoprotein
MSSDTERIRAFELFGSHVRVLVGATMDANGRSTELAAMEVEAMLRGLHRELSRFDPVSALSRLNADPEAEVRTTHSVALLVEAARRAAIESDGLVDASLIADLERVGYAESRTGIEPADLQAALESAPSRHPASPAIGSPWIEVSVDLKEAIVRRPPDMRIDSGGSGKGLAADLAAARLAHLSSYAVDCGGDIRIGGAAGLERPVEVLHPFSPSAGMHLSLAAGGIATSGLRTRIWNHADGYSHHLIDPGTGTPAWTGVVQATAIAPTAAQAETLAKAALLSGPGGARRFLSRHGGLIVLDSGGVEAIGEIALHGTAGIGAAA